MNFVKQLSDKFEELKASNSKDISCLIAILRSAAKDDDSLRWDVLVSVVSSDPEYVHLVTVAELEYTYTKMKNSIIECPPVLDIIVMNLHSDYGQHKNVLNSIEIQKRIFGEDIFSKIETATKEWLTEHYHRMLTTNLPVGMNEKDFAVIMSKIYEADYRDYYYWPTIHSVILNVLK